MTTSVPPVSGARTSAESATWAISPRPEAEARAVHARREPAALVADVEAHVIVVALGFDRDRAGLRAVAIGVQDDVGRRLGDRQRDVAQNRAILHVDRAQSMTARRACIGVSRAAAEGPRGMGHETPLPRFVEG